MAKFVFSFGVVALVVVLVVHALAAPSVNVGPLPVKDLIVHVNRVGDRMEQVVDNQQGQIVKQTVVPGGIRQTVYRNGQVITDDIVKAPTV